MRRRLTLLAWLVVLAVSSWVLIIVRERLELGRAMQPGSWDPARGGPALVALAAWILAASIVAWLTLAIVAQLVGSVAVVLQPLADQLSPRSLQRLGRGLAGLSLTAGLAAPAPSAGIPPQAPPTTVAVDLDDTTTTTSSGAGTAAIRPIDAAGAPIEPAVPSRGSVVGAEGGGTAMMRVLVGPGLPIAPPAVPVPIAPPTTLPAPPVAPTSPPDPEPEPSRRAAVDEGAPSPPTAAGRLTVQPGDSFWSIAEEELLRRTGTADEQAVVRYWRRLIDANRDRVVDPDLIHPGLVLSLPAP